MCVEIPYGPPLNNLFDILMQLPIGCYSKIGYYEFENAKIHCFDDEPSSIR